MTKQRKARRVSKKGSACSRLFFKTRPTSLARKPLTLVVASAILSLALATSAAVSDPQKFYLHDADRVVFYGDSITQQGQYTSYIEDYVATRYPSWNIAFINSGWSGDWVEGGGGGKADLRVRRDILDHHPTVVTFLLGMNDGGYQPYDPAFFDVFSKGYREILSQIESISPVPRITLLEPSPYDDVTRKAQFPDYNAVMIRYGKFVAELAHEQGQFAVDFNLPTVTLLKQAAQLEPEQARKLIPDQIHPSAAVGLFLAMLLAKAWDGAAVVSDVELDSANSKVTKSEHAHVTNIKNEAAPAWTELDEALPMPIDLDDPLTALVLRSSEIVQEMDQQRLRVAGLARERYLLKIDGRSAGSWTSHDLAQGINLALFHTPMQQQALAVHALTRRILAVRLARWQGVQVGLEDEHAPEVSHSLESLDKLQSDLVNERHALAQPKPHQFELVPQSERAPAQ